MTTTRRGPTRLEIILKLVEKEQPVAPGDEDYVARRMETLYTWCRDQLDAAPEAEKAAVTRDLQVVLGELVARGYGAIVEGTREVRDVCDARRANAGKIGELRRIVAEYNSIITKMELLERQAELERKMYLHPGESYHALHETWNEPRIQELIRALLRRLPRYVQRDGAANRIVNVVR
jgi:hypothetical protein